MRTPLRIAALAALCCALPAAAATGLSVTTNDGLSLVFDAQGRITAVVSDGSSLPVLGSGGFFVAEVQSSLVPLPFAAPTRAGVAAVGTATQSGPNEVTVTASPAGLDATLVAVLRGGPALTVDVTLTNTRGGDRAFSLYLRVPVDAAGWSWSSALGAQRAVSTTARTWDPFNWHQAYRTQTSAAPVAVVFNNDVGLALAVPPQSPAIYRLSYEPAYGLQLEFEVGTAPEPQRFPNAVNATALFYRADPDWAFRSALKRLYLLNPTLWTKRAKDGSWVYSDSTLLNLAAPEDFAIQYAETFSWANSYTRAHGIYAMKYVEPWNDHLETDPAGLFGWAQDTSTNQTWSMISKGQPREVTAQAALLSGTIGRDGQYGGYNDPANFTDQEGTHRYVLNPDREIGNFLNFTATATELGQVLNRGRSVEEYELFRQWGTLPTKSTDVNDGLYLDSCNSTGSGWAGWHLFNFRREHFTTTRAPLVFDPQTGNVALSQALSSLESVKYLAGVIREQGGVVMANGAPDPFVFTTAAYCDFVSPGEQYNGDLSRVRGMRAALYNKASSYLYNSAVTEAQFQHLLPYAVFPGGAGEEANRTVYKKWAPLMLKLGAAGWEPLTYAWTNDATVFVERFGRLKDGNLYLVAHREGGSSGPVTVTVDKAALGVTAGVQVTGTDARTQGAVALNDTGATLELSLQLAPEQSLAVAVTSVAGTPGETRGDVLPFAQALPGPEDAGTPEPPPAGNPDECSTCSTVPVDPGKGLSTPPGGTSGGEARDPKGLPAVRGQMACGGCSSGRGTLATFALFGLGVLGLRTRRRYLSNR